MRVSIRIEDAAPGQAETAVMPEPAGHQIEHILDAVTMAAAAPRAGAVVARNGTVLLVQAGEAQGTYDVLLPGCGDEFEVVSAGDGTIEAAACAAAVHAVERFGGIAWAGGPSEVVRAASKVAAASVKAGNEPSEPAVPAN